MTMHRKDTSGGIINAQTIEKAHEWVMVEKRRSYIEELEKGL